MEGLLPADQFWPSGGHGIFVLSGFLIGGHVSKAAQSGRWSATDYILRRGSRLLIVLVPALLLTALLDQAGMKWVHSALYGGTLRELYHSGPDISDAASIYSGATFVGNLLFLQTIAVPTFGTNSPLWSLSNEFWYYALFPPLFFAIRPGVSLRGRIICMAAVVAGCLALPRDIVLYGLVWLMGYGAYVALPLVSAQSRPRRVALLCAGVALFAAALLFSDRNTSVSLAVHDFLVGAAYVPLMLGCLCLRPPTRWLVTSWQRAASFSYTLYLTHFPFLALAMSLFFENRKFAATSATAALYGLIFAATILYAYLVYLLFERHTSSVQAWLSLRAKDARSSGSADGRR